VADNTLDARRKGPSIFLSSRIRELWIWEDQKPALRGEKLAHRPVKVKCGEHFTQRKIEKRPALDRALAMA
jgi:hypothetical protein